MTAHLTLYRRTLADAWTDEHRALLPALRRAGVSHPEDGYACWDDFEVVTEDLDGVPSGMVTIRRPAVTSVAPCPHAEAGRLVSRVESEPDVQREAGDDEEGWSR